MSSGVAFKINNLELIQRISVTIGQIMLSS